MPRVRQVETGPLFTGRPVAPSFNGHLHDLLGSEMEWKFHNDHWWVRAGGRLAEFLKESDLPGTARGARGWWRVPSDLRLMWLSTRGKEDPIIQIPATTKPLRPYQERAVRFAAALGRALIADGMRLGKTLEALATAYTLGFEKWAAIVPASKKWDWADEAVASIPGPPKVLVLNGRTQSAVGHAWLYVLNYEIVDAWAGYLESVGVSGVILDESVYIKGRKSKRFAATSRLCDKARYVFGLSGEPVENRPSDLWGQLRCIRGAEIGTFAEFHRRYCGGVINEWGGYDYSTATNENELRERLYTFTIRRTKFDPEVSRSLPKTTRQLVSVEGGENAAPRAAADVAITAIRSRERVLVFTYHRDAAANVAKEIGMALRALGGMEGRVPIDVLTGDVPSQERATSVRRIQQSEGPRVLVATIDSIGMGLELSSFDVVTFTELHYVPTRMLQAEERLYAVGRTRPIGIYYCVVRGSEDERVAQLVVEKLGQIERVMGEDAAATGLTKALSPGVSGGGPAPLMDLVRRLREIEGF